MIFGIVLSHAAATPPYSLSPSFSPSPFIPPSVPPSLSILFPFLPFSFSFSLSLSLSFSSSMCPYSSSLSHSPSLSFSPCLSSSFSLSLSLPTWYVLCNIKLACTGCRVACSGQLRTEIHSSLWPYLPLSDTTSPSPSFSLSLHLFLFLSLSLPPFLPLLLLPSLHLLSLLLFPTPYLPSKPLPPPLSLSSSGQLPTECLQPCKAVST